MRSVVLALFVILCVLTAALVSSLWTVDSPQDGARSPASIRSANILLEREAGLDSSASRPEEANRSAQLTPPQEEPGAAGDCAVVVSGIVVDEAGSRLIGAQVTIEAGSTQREAWTDESGAFRLCCEGVTPDGMASLRGQAVGHSEIVLFGIRVPGRYVIELPAARSSLCGSIREAVSNAPVPAAEVVLFDGLGIQQVQRVQTDENGEFCFHELHSGDYTIAAHAKRFEAAVQRASIVDGCDPTVDVFLPAAEKYLHGRVVLRGSLAPLAGIEVTDSTRRKVLTDESGEFWIPWRRGSTRGQLLSIEGLGIARRMLSIAWQESVVEIEVERPVAFGIRIEGKRACEDLICMFSGEVADGIRPATLQSLPNGQGILASCEGFSPSSHVFAEIRATGSRE